jgi:protein-tyrosine phosphatase
MLLEQQGVRLVLNTARITGCEADHQAHTAQLAARGVGYVSMGWMDNVSQRIAPEQLAACIRLIHRARLVPISCRCRADTDMAGPMRCASVLVHCSQGRSRSAALVTAYIAAVQGVSVAAALQLVQARRSIANPNIGFQRQLMALEQTGFFRALHRELRQLTGARRLALDTPTLASPTARTPLCVLSPSAHKAAPTPRHAPSLMSPRAGHAHEEAADQASPMHVRQKRRFFPRAEDAAERPGEDLGGVVDDLHALSIDL